MLDIKSFVDRTGTTKPRTEIKDSGFRNELRKNEMTGKVCSTET
jgi:hypothetical protein